MWVAILPNLPELLGFVAACFASFFIGRRFERRFPK